MQKLLEFLFERFGGKALSLGVLIVGALVAWKADNWNDRREAKADARTELNQEARKIADDMRAARDAVPADGGNVKRLLDGYCRDC